MSAVRRSSEAVPVFVPAAAEADAAVDAPLDDRPRGVVDQFTVDSVGVR